MGRKHDEDYDYLEDAFNDEKNEAAMLEAQRANNRGCLIALIAGVFGIIVISIIVFGAISAVMLA